MNADEHRMHHSSGPDIEASSPVSIGDKSSFQFVCPMHPQIIRDHEGTCPICGMKLVQQAFESGSESSQTIKIPEHAMPNMAKGLQQGFAIRTAKAQKVTLWKYMPTFGKVTADETKVIHVHPRASGWISDLTVRTNGDAIQKGELLYRLYSPEIVAAQQDYLQILQNRKRHGEKGQTLLHSAQTRLQLLGVAPKTLEQLSKTQKLIYKVPVYASQTGVVSQLSIQSGMFVQPKTELMSLTDLSTVWIEAEVLPLQQQWVKPNLTTEIRFQAYPGQYWESQIDYIEPVTDATTKALKVRMTLPNKALAFKPNMLADVIIYGGPKHNALALPMEAIIDDGETRRLVVQSAPGQFEVKTVTTGMQTQGLVEILSGIEEGDSIVISGQFLIDSESQIQANLNRFKGQAAPMSRHAHH
ncbi:efflux transporter periplasmic adaptor subunit [Hydrogenovibrio sp. SC-1]|nr:efflux transporter periplasmic adaptor subunit [Hydrogenovibrio sp. SC-1]